MNWLVLPLALFVLVVVACQLRAADPVRAKEAPIRWHLWSLARIVLATGMVARIAAVLRPSCNGESLSALLTLAGLALMLGVARRRAS